MRELIDLIPAGKYLSSLVKTEKTARSTENLISEAAQNFRLNIGLKLQLVSGVMPSGGGRLTGWADNLSAFAKSLDGSVDDIVEAGSKDSKGVSDDIFKISEDNITNRDS